MRFTDIFIRRPILAMVVSLLILLVGGASVFLLNVREYPNMQSATIAVTTSYPGATQEVMQGFVTTPISQNRTQYWYFFARNYAIDDTDLDAKIQHLITMGFEEDRYAIELVQAMHDSDGHAYREVHFKSDAPGVTMRRIVAAMARREAAGHGDADRQQAGPELIDA